MRRTFRDDGLQADFEEHGYAVVPFFDAAEVEDLTALYWRVGPAPDDPRTTIYFDFQSQDEAFKRAMVAEIRPRVEAKIEALLDDHHLFYPNFIMKWPGDRSGFAPHQDTTLVDEERFASATIWCPLTDTAVTDGVDNGVLYVLPGSHRYAPWVRAHQPGAFAFSGHEQEIIAELGVGVEVGAGEAVVFDHRLVHFSMPNSAVEPRLVLGMGVRPADAQLRHLRRREDDVTFDVYAIDDEYFLAETPFTLAERPPPYPLVGQITAVRPELTGEELRRRCAAADAGPASAQGRLVRPADRADHVNAEPFCLRCGGNEGLEGVAREEHGNVQYLCARCAA